MSTIWRFDHIENKHSLYRGKDSVKEFRKSLKRTCKKHNSFQEEKNAVFNTKRIKSTERCKNMLSLWKIFHDKNYRKVSDHFDYTGKYRGETCSICNLKLKVPNEIQVLFHNSSKYNFHLIIKELAIDCQFDCIAENSEKYKTFPIAIKKEVVKIDKEGNKIT